MAALRVILLQNSVAELLTAAEDPLLSFRCAWSRSRPGVGVNASFAPADLEPARLGNKIIYLLVELMVPRHKDPDPEARAGPYN